eukprot:gene25499-34051_t
MSYKSALPSSQPTSHPTRIPSARPSRQPVPNPTSAPSNPTSTPTRQPYSLPTSQPSHCPTSPTMRPSSQPNSRPSRQPVMIPTKQPSRQPVYRPSKQPSKQPLAKPSLQPRSHPSMKPSAQPSSSPLVLAPSIQPTKQPILQPMARPSRQPSSQPHARPSRNPTSQPSWSPSIQPSRKPVTHPTQQPSTHPSNQPLQTPTQQPLLKPTAYPSRIPSSQPRGKPTHKPTAQPSRQPNHRPTNSPKVVPSRQPTSVPTHNPTRQPKIIPSRQPTTQPVSKPKSMPTSDPLSDPTSQPTKQPQKAPSCHPTSHPTHQRSFQPTKQPPSAQPIDIPSARPSCQPTHQISNYPSSVPSQQPVSRPSSHPGNAPTRRPSLYPSSQPVNHPSKEPSSSPSYSPFYNPTEQPTSKPTLQSSTHPSLSPMILPSMQPSSVPSRQPTVTPTDQPISHPSHQPVCNPTQQPFGRPTVRPKTSPTSKPTCHPSSSRPTKQPIDSPSAHPSLQPLEQPTSQPIKNPSSQPSKHPIMKPSHQPNRKPSLQPDSHPTEQPWCQPTFQLTSIPSSSPSLEPATFLATFLIVNLTYPILLSAHQHSLLFAVASSLNLDISNVLYIMSPTKTDVNHRELSGSAVAAATTLITAPVLTSTDSGIYADYLYRQLQTAVDSAVATKFFRSELYVQLGNSTDSNAAIIAVMRGNFIAFPSLQPTAFDSTEASKSSGSPSTINQALLLGLVFGICALGCTAVPVYLLIKMNLAKKDKGKVEAAPITETDAPEAVSNDLKHDDRDSHSLFVSKTELLETRADNVYVRGKDPPAVDPVHLVSADLADKFYFSEKTLDRNWAKDSLHISFAPQVNLETLDNYSPRDRRIPSKAPCHDFDDFYKAVARGSFSDEETEADADSLITSETTKYKRGNLEFELLLKELKHMLGVDQLSSESVPSSNVTQQEFSKEENHLFELLLEKVKLILRRESGNFNSALLSEEEFFASKEENEIFELLLKEVRSMLAGRQNESSILDVEDLRDDSLTSSMLRDHLMNPRISQKFKNSLIKLSSVAPDSELESSSQAKGISEKKVVEFSEEKVASYFSTDPAVLDSHDIDFETTYSSSLSNVKNSSNAMRDAKASRALMIRSDSTPYTVKFSDIYPEAEFFYSSDGIFMKRGTDSRFCSTERKAVHRKMPSIPRSPKSSSSDRRSSRLLYRSGSFDSKDCNEAPREIATPRDVSFDVKLNSPQRQSPTMPQSLSPQNISIHSFSQPNSPDKDNPPRKAKIKVNKNGTTDAADALRRQNSPRVHDIKLKFENMIQRNTSEVNSPPKKTLLL